MTLRSSHRVLAKLGEEFAFHFIGNRKPMGGLEQERVLIRFTVKKKKKSLLSSSLDNKTV